MPKKQETTSMDLRIAYKTILDALCDIQYEECAKLLEDCLTERARMNDLDVDVSESEEEEESGEDETNYSSRESEDDS